MEKILFFFPIHENENIELGNDLRIINFSLSLDLSDIVRTKILEFK